MWVPCEGIVPWVCFVDYHQGQGCHPFLVLFPQNVNAGHELRRDNHKYGMHHVVPANNSKKGYSLAKEVSGNSMGNNQLLRIHFQSLMLFCSGRSISSSKLKAFDIMEDELGLLSYGYSTVIHPSPLRSSVWPGCRIANTGRPFISSRKGKRQG